MRKTVFHRWAQVVAPLALITMSGVAAHAQSATIDVARFGIYESFGAFSHTGDNGSQGLKRYDTGRTAPGVEARDYFVFNLTGVNFTVTSATLRIFSPGTPQTNPSGITNTLGIFAVSTPLATLTDSPDGTSASYGNIFTDLGDGTLYGSTTLNPANISAGTAINIPLTGAIAAINAAGTGAFAVGGTITDLTAAIDQALYFSGGQSLPNAQLILTGSTTAAAPEPGSLLLGAFALPVALGLIRRRKA